MKQSLIDTLIEKARNTPKLVALPECEAQNTLLAARSALDLGICTPILVNIPSIIRSTAETVGVSLDGMRIIDITDEPAQDELIERYLTNPRILSAKSCKRKIKDPVYYALMLEAVGDADCTFCGHTNTTADVLIAAQTMIGLRENVDVPSIFALVETNHLTCSQGNQIAFTDCGLNPEPTPEELASIAIASCDGVRALMGWEPRAAFLSFSTDGSGAAPSVDRIQSALSIARERRPDLKIDGEFQLDAAIDPNVARMKIKRESEVAGKANILVFPDLNAANIAVKLIQTFSDGKAYGHTLSGFCKPIADSSRGASATEIVGDIAMLVIAAANL